MTLRESFEKSGNWLFRWRSYLPLIILPLLFAALRDSEYLERHVGDFAEDLFEGICLAVSFAGLAIRCLVVGYTPGGTSGRNTKGQEAATLNTTGVYSVVRHPLYLGNFLIFLGIALSIEVYWFVIVAVLSFWLYYERIMFAEEAFLRQKFGPDFLNWAAKTPPFLPKLRNWRRPALPFSFRNVLKREYTGLFVIIGSFTLLEFAGEVLAGMVYKNGEVDDYFWPIFFVLGLATYALLRTIKKNTRLLDVEGR